MPLSWNQKFLDYEIETHLNSQLKETDSDVGIKSFSITRLKHVVMFNDYWQAVSVGIKSFSITRLKQRRCQLVRVRLHRWNQKFLDYEIETQQPVSLDCGSCELVLESKVSRLRD